MATNIAEVVDAAISELYEIAQQKRADAESSTEARAAGRVFDKAVTLIGDGFEEYAELDAIDPKALEQVSDILSTLADLLGPKTATVKWKDDEVQTKLTAVTSMASAGMLSTDQVTIVEGITSILKSSGGPRGPRGEAPVIPDRPEKVIITMLVEDDAEGNALDEPYVRNVSTLTGDKKQSADNIGTALLRLFFGKDITDEQRKSEQAKVIRETARKVVETGKPATIANVTLTPTAPRQATSETDSE